VQTTDNEHMNIIAEKYIPVLQVLDAPVQVLDVCLALRHEKYIPVLQVLVAPVQVLDVYLDRRHEKYIPVQVSLQAADVGGTN